jgi:hypothetical protein
MPTRAKVLAAKEGRQGRLGGLGIRFMIPGADSDGGFSLVEHPLEPRTLAAPLHRHSREDEYSFVLSGRIGALLGDEVVSSLWTRSGELPLREILRLTITARASPA